MNYKLITFITCLLLLPSLLLAATDSSIFIPQNTPSPSNAVKPQKYLDRSESSTSSGSKVLTTRYTQRKDLSNPNAPWFDLKDGKLVNVGKFKAVRVRITWPNYMSLPDMEAGAATPAPNYTFQMEYAFVNPTTNTLESVQPEPFYVNNPTSESPTEMTPEAAMRTVMQYYSVFQKNLSQQNYLNEAFEAKYDSNTKEIVVKAEKSVNVKFLIEVPKAGGEGWVPSDYVPESQNIKYGREVHFKIKSRLEPAPESGSVYLEISREDKMTPVVVTVIAQKPEAIADPNTKPVIKTEIQIPADQENKQIAIVNKIKSMAVSIPKNYLYAFVLIIVIIAIVLYYAIKTKKFGLLKQPDDVKPAPNMPAQPVNPSPVTRNEDGNKITSMDNEYGVSDITIPAYYGREVVASESIMPNVFCIPDLRGLNWYLYQRNVLKHGNISYDFTQDPARAIPFPAQANARYIIHWNNRLRKPVFAKYTEEVERKRFVYIAKNATGEEVKYYWHTIYRKGRAVPENIVLNQIKEGSNVMILPGFEIKENADGIPYAQKVDRKGQFEISKDKIAEGVETSQKDAAALAAGQVNMPAPTSIEDIDEQLIADLGLAAEPDPKPESEDNKTPKE